MSFSLPRAPFPAPPPFWKHFTTHNQQRLASLDSTDPSTPLPLPLTFLRPPPPPPTSASSYPIFSVPNILDITPVLPPSDILLFDPTSPKLNHATLLLKLTKSLLLNFLELITVLSETPNEHAEKTDDIRRIVINVHAVINMYRPHQARENVREMLEGVLEEGYKEIEECERVKGEIGEFLRSVEGWKDHGPGTNGSEVNGRAESKGDAATVVVGDKSLEEAKRLWAIMDEIGNE